MKEKRNEILVTEDGSKTLRNLSLNETYHSSHGALQESKHIFIQNGLAHFHTLDEVNIFEVGFGTGLNALLTFQYAEQNHQRIHYDTIEAYPITMEEVETLDYFSSIFSTQTVNVEIQLHQLSWEETHEITPFFEIQKINNHLENFLPLVNYYHCIYFDAFSPESQPEMWDISILKKMFNTLKIGGLLVTYCAKGQFKRDLKTVGFIVENIPGPPGKREMTLALKKK